MKDCSRPKPELDTNPIYPSALEEELIKKPCLKIGRECTINPMISPAIGEVAPGMVMWSASEQLFFCDRGY